MGAGRIAASLGAALVLAAVGVAAPAATGSTVASAAPPAAADSADAPGAEIPSGLVEKARDEGSVRAIITLRTGFAAEGSLTASGVARQRGAIDGGQDTVAATLRGTGARITRRYASVPLVAADLTPAAVEALAQSPAVLSVFEDVPVPMALDDTTVLTGATQTAAAGYDGTGAAVAILDSGVDGTHPFLTGKVVSEACYSFVGSCPNGQTSQTGAGAGAPCTFASACRHGTHVAGIAAGADDGTIGFDGVAPGADVIAIQIFSRFTGLACTNAGEDPCALAWISDQVAGLERVYALRNTHNIASVNMSLGGLKSTTYCDSNPVKPVIDNLRSAGIATVIAAGNDGYTDGISFPACISSAVSVGSTTKADAIASYSNSASFLSMLAPGSSIESSLPGGLYAHWSGTSMATPHVAGAFAVAKQMAPANTVSQTLALFQAAGPAITDARNGVTKHRLDLWDALTPDAPGSPTALPVDGGATVSWASPANTGGGPMTGYEVVATPGGATATTGGATNTVVTGLTAGTPYTFTVRAGNALGYGPASAASPAATPTTTIVPSVGFGAETGSPPLDIPVTLTAPSSQTVTANWQSHGWTATSGTDFSPASGTITFLPGQTSTAMPVTVASDTLDEDDEFFWVAVSGASNASIGGFAGLGAGVITDDDPLPVVTPGVAVVTEGNSGTTTVDVPVTLSAPSGRSVSVSFQTLSWTAQSPGDFTATSGTVTFAPGQTAKTVTVTVVGDVTDEANEFFWVQVHTPVNATVGGLYGLGAGVIADDD